MSPDGGLLVLFVSLFVVLWWLGRPRHRRPDPNAIPLPFIARFNGSGKAPEALTWVQAISAYPHLTRSTALPKPPKECFQCGSKLDICYHDIQDMGNGFEQPMVVTYSCPEGHGHYCDYA